MSETTKRARGDAGDDRRPLRRDPRAEPDTPPPAFADTLGPGADKLARQDAARERPPPSGNLPPTSITRASPARLERVPAADEPTTGSGPDSNASLGVAGAMGLASLRRQLATLQMQLAEAQGELGREQQGRAEDADALAVMLERVVSSERAVAEAANLRIELEHEREFVEELRASVREKYDDSTALRQKLTDTQTLLAKALEEAADRHTLAGRVELSERQLDEAKEQLEGARASDEAGRGDLALLSTQLEQLRRERDSVDAELQKANAALKNTNIKAFAASKQFDSWKSESERSIEQSRAEHQVAVDALQREVMHGHTVAAALRQQLDDAVSMLGGLTTSFEALDEREREVDGLRELARGTRRSLLDQAWQARKALAPVADVPAALSPTMAAPAAPAPSSGFAALSSAAPPASSRASRAPRPPAVPPRLPPTVKPMPERGPSDRPPAASDAALVEVGETEMRADDLVEELLEAQVRAQRLAKDKEGADR